MINKLLYQDLFNIKVKKVMKNEIIWGILQRAIMRGIMAQSAPPRLE